MSALLSEHLGYICDTNKMAIYRRALTRTITSNDVVLDLGCGTGVLGLLACRAGARRVYAVDRGPILESARMSAIDNRCDAQVVHIRGLSLNVVLPEPASLVVSDQLDPMGFEAGAFQFAADAKRRLATPEARFLPVSVSSLVAPVQLPQHETLVLRWADFVQGLSFRAFRQHAANSPHAVRPDGAVLLGHGEPLWSVSLGEAENSWSRLEGTTTLMARRPGQLNGLLGWFSADMGDGLTLTNDPTAPNRVDRLCKYLPLDPPVDVAEGDRIVATVHAVPGSDLMNWRAAVTRNSRTVARWSHSTLNGSFSLAEEIAGASAAVKPTLTAQGRAKAALLSACDGERDLRALASMLAQQHPDVAPSPEAALRFVRETLQGLRREGSVVPQRAHAPST